MMRPGAKFNFPVRLGIPEIKGQLAFVAYSPGIT